LLKGPKSKPTTDRKPCTEKQDRPKLPVREEELHEP